jgi:hypothetical protein
MSNDLAVKGGMPSPDKNILDAQGADKERKPYISIISGACKVFARSVCVSDLIGIIYTT